MMGYERFPGYVEVWSCNACGPSVTSRGNWCDRGCGSDYNQMTKVKMFLPPSAPAPETEN
jgi:hypothetical protein